MSLVRQVVAVVGKDLLIEWRSPARVSGLLFYALALVLVIAFATGATTQVLRDIAGGTLWLGLLLASTRSLDASFAIEEEQGALEGLVLWPVSPAALFYGKALANTLVIAGVSAVLAPVVLAVYDVTFRGSSWQLALFLVLGSAALAAPGTLYAAITRQARGASVLLPLLMFPLVVPALMAAARGTTLVLEGDPMGQNGGWLALLATFVAVHWLIDGLLFRFVVEDG